MCSFVDLPAEDFGGLLHDEWPQSLLDEKGKFREKGKKMKSGTAPSRGFIS